MTISLATTGSAFADTTLTVSHAWAHHAKWQKEIAQEFMKENPSVKIEFQAPSSDYDEGFVAVIRQNMAGNAPDIFLVGSHLLGALVARDMVKPLDDLIAERDMEKLGYTKSTLKLTQVNGKQYALPWTSSTPVMFFNKDLVKRAGGDPDNMPTAWDETIKLAAKIDALGDDIMGMYYTPGDDDWMTQNLLATAGLGPLTDGGKIAFRTDMGRKALGLFERFHDEGGQQAIGDRPARQQMFAGKVGLYFNSTAAVNSFKREIGDRFAWGTAVMPKLVDDGGVASGGMAAVILTDDPEKRKAAFSYLLFGTGATGQTIVVRNTGYMPVNTAALADDKLGAFYEKNPQWETSAKQMDRAYPWFAWPGGNSVRISRTVLDTMQAIANDQVDTPEAAKRLSDDIARLTK
ncbi:MAG: ABC transporter substrate-binding protein [Pseudomonadota bacterium]